MLLQSADTTDTDTWTFYKKCKAPNTVHRLNSTVSLNLFYMSSVSEGVLARGCSLSGLQYMSISNRGP